MTDKERMAELEHDLAERAEHMEYMLMELADIKLTHIKLPLDADGVPIHIGDDIVLPNGTRDRVRFFTVNDGGITLNDRGWRPSKCRVVKHETVEDILAELVNHALSGIDNDLMRIKATAPFIKDYAERIREAVEQ